MQICTRLVHWFQGFNGGGGGIQEKKEVSYFCNIKSIKKIFATIWIMQGDCVKQTKFQSLLICFFRWTFVNQWFREINWKILQVLNSFFSRWERGRGWDTESSNIKKKMYLKKSFFYLQILYVFMTIVFWHIVANFNNNISISSITS